MKDSSTSEGQPRSPHRAKSHRRARLRIDRPRGRPCTTPDLPLDVMDVGRLRIPGQVDQTHQTSVLHHHRLQPSLRHPFCPDVHGLRHQASSRHDDSKKERRADQDT